MGSFYEYRLIIQKLVKQSIYGEISFDILEDISNLDQKIEQYIMAKEIDSEARKITLLFANSDILTDDFKNNIINNIRIKLEKFVLENIDPDILNDDITSLLSSENCFDHYWVANTLTIQL